MYFQVEFHHLGFFSQTVFHWESLIRVRVRCLGHVLTTVTTLSKTQDTRQLHQYCVNGMVCHKTLCIIRHCTNYPCSHSSESQPTRTNNIHSETLLHFISASSSPHPHLQPLRVVFICLYVDCVRMTVGMNVGISRSLKPVLNWANVCSRT